MNSKKNYALAAALLTVSTGLATLATPAFAAANPSSPRPGRAWNGQMNGRGGMMRPGIFGTVTSINGNTLTVTGRQGFASSTAVATYTVDASNAEIWKDNASSALASIAVGDTVMVQGAVNGANVAATVIRDGNFPAPDKRQGMMRSGSAPEQPVFTGNGQPVVAGKVTAVNGSTISIANASNAAYTIDAANAKILQGRDTVGISSISIGDSIVVQGTVNGSTITASTVIDQTKPAGTPAASSTMHRGFFGGIGQFFARMFGF